jgi:hypothetical protein
MDDDGAEDPGRRCLLAYIARVDGTAPRADVPIVKPGSVSSVHVYELDEPRHWHLVTFGLARSGWGFELTLRLPRGDEDVPGWAVNLLATLGAYVLASGHPLAAGHHVDLRGPMRPDGGSAITAAAVTADPRLGTLDGPHGTVEFLQVVGLTADELELCRAWRTDAVLELLAESDPLLVTRLERSSILDDPAVRERAQAGVAADGSALDELRVGTLAVAAKGRRRHRLELTMGAGAATGLGPALRRKLNREGASFDLVGDRSVVHFVVAEAARCETGDPGVEAPTTVTLALPLDRVDELAGLFTGRTGAGRMEWLPGVRFVVVP